MVTPSSVQLEYTVTQGGGASLSALNAAMAAVPVPIDLLASIGVRLTGDATVSGSGLVTRTINLAFKAGTAGTATAVMSGDGTTLASVSIGTIGIGYAALPIVTVNGASLTPAEVRPYLKFDAGDIVDGGGGYTAPTIYFQGGLQIPKLDVEGFTLDPNTEAPVASCVQALQLVAGGADYSTKALVQFITDGLPAGATLPTATLTVANGVVTSIFLTSTGSGLTKAPTAVIYDPSSHGDGAILSVTMGVGTAATATITLMGGAVRRINLVGAGGPYVRMPNVAILDATGSGAVVVPLMGLDKIIVTEGGSGFLAASPPTIGIQDLFTNLFGVVDTVSLASPFWNLMKTAIEQALGSPIVSVAPAIS